MESIVEKLVVISKFNKLNENLRECERLLSEVNQNYNVNEINNSMKIFKISVECNALDENEDKKRQCYKQLKSFWPKCRYSCDGKSDLNQHISHHLNKRQFVCEEFNRLFHNNSGLLNHKRYLYSNERFFCSHCSLIDFIS